MTENLYYLLKISIPKKEKSLSEKKKKRIDRWVEDMGPKLALNLNEAFW